MLYFVLVVNFEKEGLGKKILINVFIFEVKMNKYIILC